MACHEVGRTDTFAIMADLDDGERLTAFDEVLLAASEDAVMNGLVRAAAMKLGTPIALVSLIAGRVQWFRAQTGLPAELAISKAASRCDSFCQFVVRAESLFEVTDAPSDPRVPQQLVEQYGVRAYLGAPIRYRGQVVGSFCVVDVVPRSFSNDHKKALAEYATQVSERFEEMRIARVPADVPPPPIGDLPTMRDRVATLERSMRELSALARVGAATSDLSPTEIRNALFMLRELSEFHGEVIRELRDVRISLDSMVAAQTR